MPQVNPANVKLRDALQKAGFEQRILDLAIAGHWSDFNSPFPAPKMELVAFLRRHGHDDLVQRVVKGEFDG